MANIDFFKNPDSCGVYVTARSGIWKAAEYKPFPVPYGHSLRQYHGIYRKQELVPWKGYKRD